MLGQWSQTGRTVAEFWSLTPRQIHVVLVGWGKNIDRQFKQSANLASWQVWRLANLMRARRLPQKPDDLVRKRARGVGSDWKMQKGVVELINAAFGGFDNRTKGD